MEFSGNKHRPENGLKIWAVKNENTAGYVLSEEFLQYVKDNGVALIDENGKLLESQLPDLAKDVLAYDDMDSFPATGADGVLYIDKSMNVLYRWNGTSYVSVSADTSELEQRVDTLETEVSTLKSENRIQGIKIENLEAMAEGKIKVDHVEDTTDGVLDLPSGKLAPYAEVDAVMGKSVAWNQLAPSATTTTDWNIYDSSKMTLVNDDGGIKATFKVQGSGYAHGVRVRNQVSTAIGHVCICTAMIKTEAGLDFDCEINNVGVASIEGTLAVNQWNPYTFVSLTNRASTLILLKPKTTLSVGQSYWVKDVHLVDLTTLFGVTSVSQVTAFMREWARAYADAHPQYNAGQIVDSTPTEVRSVGRNLQDSTSTVMAKLPSSYSFINVVTEDGSAVGNKFRLVIYKADGTYRNGWNSNNSLFNKGAYFSIPKSYINDDAVYFRVCALDSNVSACPYKVYAEFASTETKPTYTPYRAGLLTLPTLPPLRGVGTARDIVDIKERVYEGMKSIDLSSKLWQRNGNLKYTSISDIISHDDGGRSLSDRYAYFGYISNVDNLPMETFTVRYGNVYIMTADATPSGTLHYPSTSGGETYKARVLERNAYRMAIESSKWKYNAVENSWECDLTPQAKGPADSVIKAEFICDNYTVDTGYNVTHTASQVLNTIAISTNGQYARCYNGSNTTKPNNCEIVYRLASPQLLDITDLFANFEPFIEAEAGGTISVISEGAQADASIHYQSQLA